MRFKIGQDVRFRGNKGRYDEFWVYRVYKIVMMLEKDNKIHEYYWARGVSEPSCFGIGEIPSDKLRANWRRYVSKVTK